MSEKLLKFVVPFICCLLFYSSVNGQSQKEKITLKDWLSILKARYEVSFSYNNKLLDKLEIPAYNDCSTLQSCLNYLQQQTPIKFDKADADNFLILPIRKTARFEVIEENKESIIAITATINSQQELYLLPQEGKYTLENVFPTDTVTIRSRFFLPYRVAASELLTNNAKVTLLPSTTYLSEVVVKDYLTSGVDSRLNDHSLQINMNNLGLLAGESDGDILTVLKNIPGVRTPDGKPGSLNFRGSTFDQTLIYLDEIPIYHTGHFFGTISPYNPIAIDKVDIYRGTLPAKWGGRVGGLINMKTDNPLSDSVSGSIALNTIYAGAKIKAPIIDDKLGIFFAFRTSYPYNDLPPKLQAFSDLNFQGSRIDPFFIDGNIITLDRLNVRFRDMNGKVAFRPNSRHEFSLSFVNIVNRFGAELNSNGRNEISQIQQLDLDNWGITGKWKAHVTNKTDLSIGASTSSLKIFDQNDEVENGVLDSTIISRNNLDDNRLFIEGDIKVNNHLKFNTGYTLTNHQIEFNPLTKQNGNQTNDSRVRNSQKATIHAFHLSATQNWGSKLIMNLGIHSDYYDLSDEIFVDPRVSLSYRASDFIYLKASGGRSRQFIKQVFNDDFDDFRINTQFWSLSDKKNQALEAIQGMVGLLYEKSNWLVDIELYTRHTDNIDNQEGPNTSPTGSLSAIGADIFVKRKWSNVETWLSYSASHVETEFRQTNTAFYDQPHILNLTGLINANRWKFAISWGLMSGLPVVLPDSEDANTGNLSFLAEPFGGRFPNQHQLDVSATYSFHNPSNSWQGLIGISFLNVYDQENIVNIFQENLRVENPYRNAVGFAPNINLKISF